MGQMKVRLLAIGILAAVGVAVLLIPRGSTAEPALSGTSLEGKPAPDFRLADQFGRFQELSQFRGRPVVLTFLRAHCTEECPIVAEKLRQGIAELGRAGKRTAILVVSVDPERDTVQAVRQFSRKHGMLHRWHYLMGSRKHLAPIWRAYAIYAPPRNASQALSDMHTSATYLIDQEGRERALFASDLNTAALVRDLRILSGLPARPQGKEFVPAPEVGHPAPDFVLNTVDGRPLALSSLHGKVVLLNFWATWCIPCRTEMPELARSYRQLRGQGFVVLGVDKQEPRGDVKAFLRQFHIPYPVVLDESGSVVARYNVIALPSTFVIDRQGVIRSVHLGIVDRKYLSEQIHPLLETGG